MLQVTHDFTEAGLLGDVAILLDSGRVLQSGRPEEVFRKPASAYVAEFLGAENVFAGTARLVDVDASPGDGAADSMLQAVEFRTGPLTIYAIMQRLLTRIFPKGSPHGWTTLSRSSWPVEKGRDWSL